jgi:hypothetical protein
MRKLVVRYWAKHVKPESMLEHCDFWPRDALKDILHEFAVLRDDKNASNPTFKHRCDYHEHDETAPKGPGCINSPEVIAKQNKASSE